ncbi:cytochrome P450 [Streptomyces violascens]|uniref:Mycocyclosin synthase n=1 Tax=Streptomyces violascens TaxID=67381 RepID=A0ABQ3QKE5_9ACTN|nr:cytochrome P450 [Streptomyces violascens]GGT93635.1 mycocyclosin synthase [Streptomyces violascens]GHI37738.1 mycocyclosin synthase [Streptomyces violascens]
MTTALNPTAPGCPVDHDQLTRFPFDANGTALPPQIAQLLAHEPVKKVRTIAGAEAWLVSSYPLCRQVLDDDRYSLAETSAPGAPRQYALTIPPEVVNNMGNITGAGLRKAVMKALNPKSPGLEDWLYERARHLADRLMAAGAPSDLRYDFTVPYSTALHTYILGIPEADSGKLYDSLHIAFMNSPREIPAAAMNWDRDIAHMVRRLNDPETGGLLGELAALRDDPDYAHLTDEMLATVGVTMFGAGVISVMGFLTMAIVSLVQHPELKARLVADPSLIPAAVDELLRINLSIADGLPRIATETMLLGDVEIQKGELVLVLVEAANHDPQEFEDPHTVRLDRPNANGHLSFGGGGHYCPATALGKRHAQIAIEVLLDRMPGLDLAVPIEQLVWRTGFMKRIPERLPVLW